MDPNIITCDEVLHDFLPFFRVYKDGSVHRYILTATVPPGPDPATGAQSKDIIFSQEPKLGARIFLPKLDVKNQIKKLPLIVHYHGGGFCTGSAYGPIMKHSLTQFVSFANVAIISIDYRLAPENPMPIAYEDAWAGLKWIAAHSKGNGPDPWLNEYVDFKKVYLNGESSGANIAHNVAIRASVEPIEGIKLVGMSLIHPYFANNDPDPMIDYLYPTSGKLDQNPKLNPGVDPRLPKLVCERVLVCVAERDVMRNRGVSYYKTLVKSGWGGIAEFLETEDEGHCFHLFQPHSARSGFFLYKLASFVSDDM